VINVNNPLVSAFILHCESPNGDQLLWETLDSLENQTYSNLNVYVIENGCNVDWLPIDSRLHIATNIGVARGYNVGLLQKGGDYTLLLNNDIYCHKGMVSELVKTGESDDTIGIIAPRIYYHASNRIWYDGGLFNPWTGVTRHEGIRKIGAVSKEKETDWATGCAMMIKSEVIEKVGLMDEAFGPAYSEDIDFSMRTRLAGFKIVVNPKAKMSHKISSSIGILKTAT